MIDDDQQREVEIDAAYARLLAVETPKQQGEVFARMKSLIAGRSTAQIGRMERERGLCAS